MSTPTGRDATNIPYTLTWIPAAPAVVRSSRPWRKPLLIVLVCTCWCWLPPLLFVLLAYGLLVIPAGAAAYLMMMVIVKPRRRRSRRVRPSTPHHPVRR